MTWPDIASQEIPVKLQGDSESFQLCREFNGSFNCCLNWRRAWVSIVSAFEDRKRVIKRSPVKRRERVFLAIVTGTYQLQNANARQERLIYL